MTISTHDFHEFRRVYQERCYDTSPLTPVSKLASAAVSEGRQLKIFDVGGNIGITASYFAEQVQLFLHANGPHRSL